MQSGHRKECSSPHLWPCVGPRVYGRRLAGFQGVVLHHSESPAALPSRALGREGGRRQAAAMRSSTRQSHLALDGDGEAVDHLARGEHRHVIGGDAPRLHADAAAAASLAQGEGCGTRPGPRTSTCKGNDNVRVEVRQAGGARTSFPRKPLPNTTKHPVVAE